MAVRGVLIVQLMSLTLTIHLLAVPGELFKPFNVSYDHRALIIDGKRRMLISAGVHYPRATPEMWPDIIEKSKEGGADVIQSYVFWNGHEPTKGQYNFDGRYDLVKFIRLVGSSGLYLHLRIGPYVCAEWNFGGFPLWLRDVPGIEFRTDNAPFKEEMQRFVKKIVDLLRDKKLFCWQGGPVIMLQVENEYGNIESSYGKRGQEYIKWVANMALGLGAEVPWVMCQQKDAPSTIINSCNGYYCDGFKANSPSKPIFWTENWDGWFSSWGERLPHRPVEDLAFSVARFFQREGSFQNYYMYFGGTNFGRTAGGPFYITSYDYDSPIDEYGLIREPKWGHLKDLHTALKLCEPALVSADSPQYIKLGPKQELETLRNCSAFLANIDERKAVAVKFNGQTYNLPPWSVSILPDCQNVVFNTAKLSAPLSANVSLKLHPADQNELSIIANSWMTVKEPIGIWSDQNFTVKGILEHLNVTKDRSDYLWYLTRFWIKFPFAGTSKKYLHICVVCTCTNHFANSIPFFPSYGRKGSAIGQWVKFVQPVQFLEGYNDLLLLSQAMGLQNSGAFIEKDGAGIRGRIKLTGFKNGDIDLSESLWTYQVGLKGEFLNFYSLEENEKADWTKLSVDAIPSTFTWYKAYFSSPDGTDPVAINLGSMGKGQAWVNGHHIGRYWSAVSPKDGCAKCDYRGAYNSGKCVTNCGRPTQSWYHIPRSWLKESSNLLVLFEETGGNPLEIVVKLYSTGVICGQVSESHYPPLRKLSNDYISDGETLSNRANPEMFLHCDDGHVISSLEFASYGTPQGSCNKFSRGRCHATNSLSVVSQACLGKNSCTVEVSNSAFGGDPCHSIVKTLAVEARCSSTSSIHFSV
ncbi:beta-galactosidase 9 isoform X1 [Cucumis melo var. makuwa]|uniref:Beta-galactosidase n=1 Tax=Cucumis melo var. makuwa TaxID=1194695 RepID=A0A5A7U690_CUCMM|nr:beta-galactosidase 9 isoform X1 [Cucumis melo var. makuwa]